MKVAEYLNRKDAKTTKHHRTLFMNIAEYLSGNPPKML